MPPEIGRSVPRVDGVPSVTGRKAAAGADNAGGRAHTSAVRSSGGPFARVGTTVVKGVHWSLVWVAAGYVLWVLASVVAFVSHLGGRVPALGAVMAGSANPLKNEPAGLVECVRVSLPPSLAFVLSHSLLRPVQLARLGFRTHGQLLYCIVSAATLHWFIAGFVPHDSPVVMVLPLPALAHNILSAGALTVAFAALLAERKTYALLGVPQALSWLESDTEDAETTERRKAAREKPEAGMDIITWQGVLMYKLGGAMAFILFSGLSILPVHVTVSDLVVRVGAALYLRLRSRGFRGWVDKIEHIHLFTWLVRLGLAIFALKQSSPQVQVAMLVAGVIGTVALRVAEGSAKAKRV